VLLQYPQEWTATFEATLAPGSPGRDRDVRTEEAADHAQPVRVHAGGPRAKSEVVRRERAVEIDHVGEFLDCMRTRKRPNGDVYIGHRSAQASHLGNIAYLQRGRSFRPVRKRFCLSNVVALRVALFSGVALAQENTVSRRGFLGPRMRR